MSVFVHSHLRFFFTFLILVCGNVEASTPLLVDFDVGDHKALLKIALSTSQTIAFNIDSAADLDALGATFVRLEKLSQKESYQFLLPIEQVAWLLSYSEQVKPLISAYDLIKEDRKDLIATLNECSWEKVEGYLDCHTTVKERALRRESKEALALDMRTRAQNIVSDWSKNGARLAQRLQNHDQALADEFSKQAVLILHLAHWQNGVEALNNSSLQRYSAACTYSPFDTHYEHTVVGWNLDDLSNMCERFTKIEQYLGEGRPYLNSTPAIVNEGILISGVCPNFHGNGSSNIFTPVFGLTTAEVEARCDLIDLGFYDKPARGIASQHLVNLEDGKQETVFPFFGRIRSLEMALIRQSPFEDPDSMAHETLFSNTTTDPKQINEMMGAFYQEVGWVPSLCFNPHHKLVITTTNGDVYTLIICFGCSQARIWKNNKQIMSLLLRSDVSASIIEAAAHGAYWSNK